MSKDELQELRNMFADGSGFGDPDARRNAELRLQVCLAEQQLRNGARLNVLTFISVVVGLLQFVLVGFQVLDK